MIGRMSPQTLDASRRAPATLARRRRSGSGIALILAGLAVLGYVAWQFFGTNIVAKQKQQSIVAETQQALAVPGRRRRVGHREGRRAQGRPRR